MAHVVFVPGRRRSYYELGRVDPDGVFGRRLGGDVAPQRALALSAISPSPFAVGASPNPTSDSDRGVGAGLALPKGGNAGPWSPW